MHIASTNITMTISPTISPRSGWQPNRAMPPQWELLIALRSRSAHAPRHEASDANESAVQKVGPDHRATSAVRFIHDSVVWNINPLAINAYAIVTILSFPIGVINALRIGAIAAGPLAAVQTL